MSQSSVPSTWCTLCNMGVRMRKDLFIYFLKYYDDTVQRAHKIIIYFVTTHVADR